MRLHTLRLEAFGPFPDRVDVDFDELDQGILLVNGPTGSGKTLTSFKASQVIVDNPKVAKVVFVVDRADLDYQTTKEFNYFSPGSVDGTDNTKALVDQLADPDTKLVVTTIQKLNTAITRERHAAAMEARNDNGHRR